MYSHGASSSINNPFASDPSNAQSRYPDISGASSPQYQGLDAGQYVSSWQQTQGLTANPTGYNPSYGQQQYQQLNQGGYSQQQTQPQYGYANANPQGYQYGASPAQSQSQLQFQPSSSFGQQLVGQVNATPAYGGGGFGAQPTGYAGGYGGAQIQSQPTNQLPSHLSQFDPFSAIGQGWDPTAQQQQQTQAQAQSQPQTTSTDPAGNPHPRNYIRTHKAELESWDPYSWKQMLGAFDALKEAWEKRKVELEGRLRQIQQHSQQVQMQMQFGAGGYGQGYGYNGQIEQEGVRLQGLLKDANANFDSTAASTFQMREVFSGYRQSGDLASKRRVREACNASLTGLPDWPGQY